MAQGILHRCLPPRDFHEISRMQNLQKYIINIFLFLTIIIKKGTRHPQNSIILVAFLCTSYSRMYLNANEILVVGTEPCIKYSLLFYS